MMSRSSIFVLLSWLLLPPWLFGQDEMTELVRELSREVQDGSLINAAETVDKLDAGVQARYRAWLVRDSNERADEVLSWLPADMEGFWVNRQPVEIGADRAASSGPFDSYMSDRLKAQSEGHYFSLMQGRTVRMVMAAVRAVPPPQFEAASMPATMTAKDVIYFYFLTAPLDPGNPDEVVQASPLWRGTAEIVGSYVPQPRVRPTPHEDINWLALPKPDLLILSNNKNLLLSVLLHIVSGPATTHALPAELPEWLQADRSADFWGVRHFSAESRPQPGERGCETAELPFPDCRATGATVRFDAATGTIDIRYLSGANVKPVFERIGFQIGQPQPGVWKLDADAVTRGPTPAAFGLAMLGFGGYQ
jgi:hypothetical protein